MIEIKHIESTLRELRNHKKNREISSDQYLNNKNALLLSLNNWIEKRKY